MDKKPAMASRPQLISEGFDDVKPSIVFEKQATCSYSSSDRSTPSNTAEYYCYSSYPNSLTQQQSSTVAACESTSDEIPHSFAEINTNVERDLGKECIVKASTRTDRYPKRFESYEFYCQACNYFIEDILMVREHRRDPMHHKLKEDKLFYDALNFIPAPTCEQLNVLGNVVKQLANEHGRSAKVFHEIANVALKTAAVFKKQIDRDCSVRMFGSCLSGFALNSSDVNLELIYPVDNLNPKEAFELSYSALVENADIFENVTADFFECRHPQITFQCKTLSCNDRLRETRFTLTVRKNKPSLISALLSIYSSLHPAVRILGQVWRYWAKTCRLDSLEYGGMSAYAFDILLIHFLQQQRQDCAVKLPCLHKLYDAATLSAILLEVADLLLPCSFHDGVLSPALELLQKFKVTVELESHELGALWLNLLSFYAWKRNNEQDIVSIEDLARVPRVGEKVERGRRRNYAKSEMNVQDPFCAWRNLAKTCFSPSPAKQRCSYFSYCLQSSFAYFATPQTMDGPLFEISSGNFLLFTLPLITSAGLNESLSGLPESSAPFCPPLPKPAVLVSNLEASLKEIQDRAAGLNTEHYEYFFTAEKLTDGLTPDILNAQRTGYIVHYIRHIQHSTNASGTENDVYYIQGSVFTISRFYYRLNDLMKCQVWLFISLRSLLCDTVLFWSFEFPQPRTKSLLTFQEPLLFCSFCKVYGHKRSQCKQDKLPRVSPLPDTVDENWELQMSTFLRSIHDERMMTDENSVMRAEICRIIQHIIGPVYPSAKVTENGSSTYCLGTNDSDLDLCVNFDDSDCGPASEKSVAILERLSELLQARQDSFSDVSTVMSRTPILQCVERQSAICVDICVNHPLGIATTELISNYAALDQRFPILAICLKDFVKNCRIVGAKDGYLSSTAYNFMLIYYLQQCCPPVLPVLQELKNDQDETRSAENVVVLGTNIYFLSAAVLKQKPQLWPYSDQNKQSLFQLWLGFFLFYTETFNWKRDVVCIRQRKLLQRLEKFWTKSPAAIENAFPRDQNLAAGVGAIGFHKIMKHLILGRRVFGKNHFYNAGSSALTNITDDEFNAKMQQYLRDHIYPANVQSENYFNGAYDEYYESVADNDIAFDSTQMMESLYAIDGNSSSRRKTKENFSQILSVSNAKLTQQMGLF